MSTGIISTSKAFNNPGSLEGLGERSPSSQSYSNNGQRNWYDSTPVSSTTYYTPRTRGSHSVSDLLALAVRRRQDKGVVSSSVTIPRVCRGGVGHTRLSKGNGLVLFVEEYQGETRCGHKDVTCFSASDCPYVQFTLEATV